MWIIFEKFFVKKNSYKQKTNTKKTIRDLQMKSLK